MLHEDIHFLQSDGSTYGEAHRPVCLEGRYDLCGESASVVLASAHEMQGIIDSPGVVPSQEIDRMVAGTRT